MSEDDQDVAVVAGEKAGRALVEVGRRLVEA